MVDGSNPSTPTNKITIVPGPPGTILNNSVSTFGITLCNLGITLCQDDPSEILACLKHLQQLHRLSARRLAQFLELSEPFLSRLLTGKRPLTPSAAENILQKLQTAAENGKFGAPDIAGSVMRTQQAKRQPGLTLVKAITNFITAKKVEGKSPKTIIFYGDNMERFRWWCHKFGASQLIGDISTEVLREFLLYVKTATNRWGIGSTSSRKKASLSTVDAYWRTLQAFFSFLVGDEYLSKEQNPMRKIQRTKAEEKIIKDIPAPMILKVLELFGGNTPLAIRNRAIFMVFIDTGGRLSEVTGLKLADLDLVNGRARVDGKGGIERFTGLGPYTVETLKLYLSTHLRTNGLLWLKADGSPLGYFGIQTLIRRLKKLGADLRWTPHTLRNTFAMNFLRAGGDPFTLQILGGWKDLDMPRHYTAALTAEDALKVHRRASPVDFIINGKKDKPNS